MSPLFSPALRETVVQAQNQARGLGHDFIGGEHLLLALAGSWTPAGAALREQGVTPDQVRAQILRLLPGAGRAGRDPRGAAIDAEALATIGIDLDAVRARVERAFGPGALSLPVRCSRRPAWRRIRLPRRPGHRPSRGHHLSLPGGHLPLTSRAKQMLECAQREARAQQATTAGAGHLALAVIATDGGGMAPAILSALGVAEAPLRAAILDRYGPAS